MGQVLHGSATTTEAIRRAIQNSQVSLIALSRRYGVNPKTVAKWRACTTVSDTRTGPTDPKSTVLTSEEEAVIVAFRKHTLLPFDDCLYSLQPTIPHLTRSSLHRCLQRHGISRLPEVEGDKPDKKKFKSYPIGYFHVDIAEVQTAEGKLYLFVAFDRASRFALVQLHKRATKMIAAAFLADLIKAPPYAIHTILTDRAIGAPLVRETMARGIQFANRKQASQHLRAAIALLLENPVVGPSWTARQREETRPGERLSFSSTQLWVTRSISFVYGTPEPIPLY